MNAAPLEPGAELPLDLVDLLIVNEIEASDLLGTAVTSTNAADDARDSGRRRWARMCDHAGRRRPSRTCRQLPASTDLRTPSTSSTRRAPGTRFAGPWPPRWRLASPWARPSPGATPPGRWRQPAPGLNHRCPLARRSQRSSPRPWPSLDQDFVSCSPPPARDTVCPRRGIQGSAARIMSCASAIPAKAMFKPATSPTIPVT